jgi:hypothetical protein
VSTTHRLVGELTSWQLLQRASDLSSAAQPGFW